MVEKFIYVGGYEVKIVSSPLYPVGWAPLRRELQGGLKVWVEQQRLSGNQHPTHCVSTFLLHFSSCSWSQASSQKSLDFDSH